MAQLDGIVHEYVKVRQPGISCRNCEATNGLQFCFIERQAPENYAGAYCDVCGWQWWKNGRKDD